METRLYLKLTLFLVKLNCNDSYFSHLAICILVKSYDRAEATGRVFADVFMFNSKRS